MSNFSKKLASVRNARLNKIAEEAEEVKVDPKTQEYITKMQNWGVTIDPENAKPKTKEDSWTSMILIVKSPEGQAWINGTLMLEPDKKTAEALLIDKIKEINAEFTGFGAYFSLVSEAKLREYEMVILPKVRYKGMTGGEQVTTWLYGAINSFYGDGVFSEVEEDEIMQRFASLFVTLDLRKDEDEELQLLSNEIKKLAARYKNRLTK